MGTKGKKRDGEFGAIKPRGVDGNLVVVDSHRRGTFTYDNDQEPDLSVRKFPQTTFVGWIVSQGRHIYRKHADFCGPALQTNTNPNTTPTCDISYVLCVSCGARTILQNMP